MWIFHPLSVPAFDQLPATLHTRTAGCSNGIDLIIPEKRDGKHSNIGWQCPICVRLVEKVTVEIKYCIELRHQIVSQLFLLEIHLLLYEFLLVSVSWWYFGPVSCNCLEVLKKWLDLFLEVWLKWKHISNSCYVRPFYTFLLASKWAVSIVKQY